MPLLRVSEAEHRDIYAELLPESSPRTTSCVTCSRSQHVTVSSATVDAAGTGFSLELGEGPNRSRVSTHHIKEAFMASVKKIAPCLWFSDQAEEAAKYYVGIFKNSKIGKISRYGEAGRETHRRPPGSVMTVQFELEGQPFTALNGGPVFTFNEAISLQIYCKDQKELDYYWEKLTAGGDPKARCAGGSRTSTACPGRWCRRRLRT